MDKKRTTPPIDLVEYATEHVRYEAAMFVEARNRLTSPASAGPDMNFHVEGFALHLRNLLDFFYLENPRPDDVIASDYVPEWETIRPEITPILTAARKRANKEIAHLTTQRKTGTPPDKHWDCCAVSVDINLVVRKFIDSVDRTIFSAIALEQFTEILKGG